MTYNVFGGTLNLDQSIISNQQFWDVFLHERTEHTVLTDVKS